MILKALYDYYHRSGDDVAPFGLEYKEIGFIIVIDRCGKFLRFEDRRIDKKSAQRFLVKKSVSRSSAPVANYLYDNCKYVFGYSDKGDMEKIRKYFEVFKAKVKDIYDAFPDNEDIKAVYAFYHEGGNLAASKIRNLECPSYEICLIDYGCGKFNRKIHIMEQYP